MGKVNFFFYIHSINKLKYFFFIYWENYIDMYFVQVIVVTQLDSLVIIKAMQI